MIKRKLTDITCECCGKDFRQTRFWQVYCSKACKQEMLRASVSELRKLRLELKAAKIRIEELLTELSER